MSPGAVALLLVADVVAWSIALLRIAGAWH